MGVGLVMASAVAGLVSSAHASTGGAVAGDAGAPAGGLERFTGQTVTWHSCRTGPDDELGAGLEALGARCADVTVPLDYSRPEGRTITVAISRRPAGDPARRLGTLVVNPGGPGEGLAMGVTWVLQGMPPFVAAGSPRVAARYDLVGMDPRFHHRSSPLECGWPTELAERAAFVGPDRRSFERSVSDNRELAGRCTRLADLLPYASTRNAARDLDVVRAVLGERRISFLGWSYGSYLGAAYAELFPGRLERTVLDSAVDPLTWGAEVSRGTSPAKVAEQRNWAAWVARHDRTYHLGATPARVMASLDLIRRVADRGRPVQIGRHRVDLNSLRSLVVSTDLEETYAQWAHLVTLFHDGARGRKVTLTAADDAFFAYLSSKQVAVGASAVRATLCADRPARSRDPEVYFRDIQAHRVREPFFGPTDRNLTPCTFWPVAPAEPPLVIDTDVPVLLVGATGDPTTAYAGQLAMRRALPGSRLVTLAGAFRHGVYLFDGDPCVDARVDRYLLDGVLPDADVTCRRPSPRPAAAPASAAAPAA